MNQDLLELERALANINAEITILKSNYELMKENQQKLADDIVVSNKEIIDIKMEIASKFNMIDSDITAIQKDVTTMNKDLVELTNSVQIVDDKLDSLSNNTLLSFFAELDIKKAITLIVIITSLLSSPTVIDKLLIQDNQDDKIDQLIEMLQPDPNAPPTGVR